MTKEANQEERQTHTPAATMHNNMQPTQEDQAKIGAHTCKPRQVSWRLPEQEGSRPTSAITRHKGEHAGQCRTITRPDGDETRP